MPEAEKQKIIEELRLIAARLEEYNPDRTAMNAADSIDDAIMFLEGRI